MKTHLTNEGTESNETSALIDAVEKVMSSTLGMEDLAAVGGGESIVIPL